MICTVVGARPNFVKMAPIIAEINRRGLAQVFVHTGQHYDERMSKVFFGELDMPRPDVYLGIGSGSHADQTARVMMAFEAVLLEHEPDYVVVAGDVNSTLACALTAAKLHIPVAHVESGLRSFDGTMPEEINRILTDQLADLLFTTEPSGALHLRQEGISPDKIHFVGNTMIDSLTQHLPAARQTQAAKAQGYEPGQYGLVTLHRPANVDNPEVFAGILGALETIGADLPLLFPVHPRTQNQMAANGVKTEHINLVDPLGYLQFLGLMAEAKLVLTDSGGIQEETTALGVPCVTIRENTERPVTIDQGTNRLAGVSEAGILAAAQSALRAPTPDQAPELWDGQAALRLTDILEAAL